MNISKIGVNLIAEFEGFFPKPYNDPVGHATIGYGHLIHYGNVTIEDNKKWGTITEQEGKELLDKDLNSFEDAVDSLISVPLNQNQFDALVSFSYNVGTGALSSSTLRKKLNAKDYNGAANEFDKWVYASGQKFEGLVRRRAAEKKLFLKQAISDKQIQEWRSERKKLGNRIQLWLKKIKTARNKRKELSKKIHT